MARKSAAEFRYDPRGNQVAILDPLGRVNWTCYDLANRPVRNVRNFQAASANRYALRQSAQRVLARRR